LVLASRALQAQGKEQTHKAFESQQGESNAKDKETSLEMNPFNLEDAE
jgi:hypothetical protein